MDINIILLGQLFVVHIVVVAALQIFRTRQVHEVQVQDILLFVFAWLVPLFGALSLALVTIFGRPKSA